MKLKLGIAIALALLGLPAHAVRVVTVQLDQIGQTLPKQDQVQFDFSLTPIADWSESHKEALNLFPGFKAIETLNAEDGSEDLEIYESKAAFIVNRPVAELDLTGKSSVDFIQSFDSEIRHKAVQPAVANLMYKTSNEARLRTQRTSLENRLKRGKLSQAQYESALSNLENQAAHNSKLKWCAEAGSECVASAVDFPADWQVLLESGKAASLIDLEFPKTIEFMSEVLKGPVDLFADRAEVQALSETISLPAQYVLIESSFWFNRFLQSGKTVISFHAIDDSQTLVVVSTVFGIEADALTKYDMLNFKVRDVFLGDSIFVNRDEGFAKGLPPYNKDLAISLKAKLESL